MALLIGTNHELQHHGKPFRIAERKALRARQEFKEYLRQRCSSLKLDLVAEESCADILNAKRSDSTVREVAREFLLEHKLCDPNFNERIKLGLPGHGTGNLPEERKRHFHSIREKYWLDQIRDYKDKPVLFVCGAEHVSSFSDLLSAGGFEVRILDDYWGSDYYDT